jgi:hypothetical protein
MTSQCPLGGAGLSLRHEQRRNDAQVLGLADGIEQAAADFVDLVQLAPRERDFAARYADLGPSPQCRCAQGAVARGFGFADGLVGFGQRAIEIALLAIGDAQIVPALGDALPQPRPCERGHGDVPRPDCLGAAARQIANDPQVVRAPPGRREIRNRARSHHGLREIVRRLIDASADERDRTARVEGATLDRVFVALAGLLQRAIQPAQPFIVASHPRLRRAVQQGERRGVFKLPRLLRAEVLDHLGVMARRCEFLGFAD